MAEPVEKVIKKGTVVKIAGIPVELTADVPALSQEGNWKLIEQYGRNVKLCETVQKKGLAEGLKQE